VCDCPLGFGERYFDDARRLTSKLDDTTRLERVHADHVGDSQTRWGLSPDLELLTRERALHPRRHVTWTLVSWQVGAKCWVECETPLCRSLGEILDPDAPAP